VTRVYTDVAVFLIRPEGVLVRETHGMSFEQLQAIVPVPLARV
jgi:3-oxoadipate CoA-transferase beta subunit